MQDDLTDKQEPAIAAPAPAGTLPVTPGGWTFWQILAAATLGVLGFSAAFSHVWNFDIFWHLACGEWMLRNSRVMGFDYFSVDPQPQWINVHWLFQIIVTGLYKLGGFEVLSLFKAVASAAGLLVLVLALRRHVPAGWLIFCGTLALYVMQARLRVRPEIFTLALLLLTLALTDSVRRGASTRRLWWMVPIMAFWVNVHGLFFLGLGVLWTMIIGGLVGRLLSKRLPRFVASRVDWGQPSGLTSVAALAPALAATLACLLTPWPIQTLIHPVLLSTRMSDPIYVNGVTELARTFQFDWNIPFRDQLLYKFHREAIVLILLTAAAMIANIRRLPIAHVVLFVVFIAIGLLARRNMGLLAPVSGYFLAIHGGAGIREITQWLPRLSRWLGKPLTILLAAASVALSVGYLTGALPKYHGHGPMPGMGLAHGNHSVRTAGFLAALPVQGDVFCENFGDGGVFDYHFMQGRSEPVRRLYMDGRLEAHSLEKFKEVRELRNMLTSEDTADMAKFPPSIRFVIIRFDSDTRLNALMNTPRFRLIHIDQAGACFERADWAPTPPAKDQRNLVPQEPNFQDHDRPLQRDYTIEGLQRPAYSWYRQNPPALDYQMGALLLELGREPFYVRPNSTGPVKQKCVLLAMRYLQAALASGLTERNRNLGALAQASQQRALHRYVEPSELVPVDIYAARAAWLYRQINLRALGKDVRTAYSRNWIECLVQAGQLDEAQDVTTRLFSLVGKTPAGDVGAELEKARQAATEHKLYDLPLLQRARALGSPRYSLINEAIGQLEAADQLSADQRLLLGDLLLRKGMPAEAKVHYAQVTLAADRQWEIDVRYALCDWVEGKLFEAYDSLKELSGTSDKPLAKYYLVGLADLTGRYEVSKELLRNSDLRQFLRQTEKPTSPLSRPAR